MPLTLYRLQFLPYIIITAYIFTRKLYNKKFVYVPLKFIFQICHMNFNFWHMPTFYKFQFFLLLMIFIATCLL